MTEILTNKDAYRAWVQTQHTMPICMQPWWMDAVTAGYQWDVILIRRGETILAAMPYMIRRRLRMPYIIMPPKTQIGGLWLNEHLELNDLLYQQVAEQLNRQLQDLKLGYYYQHWPVHSPLARRMTDFGYSVRERVTYQVDETHHVEACIKRFSRSKRKQIQKAEASGLQLQEAKLDAEHFYQFHHDCLVQQHKEISYSREFLLVLERKARKLGQCCILSVSDTSGNVLAAAFLVWDQSAIHYFIHAIDPQYKDSGAGALLVLGALRIAERQKKILDFDGSMVRAVARHYRKFGAAATVYCSVERVYNPFFRFLLWINRIRVRRL